MGNSSKEMLICGQFYHVAGSLAQKMPFSYINKTAPNFISTVKPVYNDNPQNPKFVAVVERWSLFRGSFMLYEVKMAPKMVVVVGRWSLFGADR